MTLLPLRWQPAKESDHANELVQRSHRRLEALLFAWRLARRRWVMLTIAGLAITLTHKVSLEMLQHANHQTISVSGLPISGAVISVTK